MYKKNYTLQYTTAPKLVNIKHEIYIAYTNHIDIKQKWLIYPRGPFI